MKSKTEKNEDSHVLMCAARLFAHLRIASHILSDPFCCRLDDNSSENGDEDDMMVAGCPRESV